MQKDQREFFCFVRDQYTSHKKLYSLHMGGVLNRPLVFLERILEKLSNDDEEEKEEEDYQKHHSKRSKKSIENLEKKDKKKSRKKVSFQT